MSKDDKNTIKGVVVESLPNTMFRIQPVGKQEDFDFDLNLDENGLMLAYLAGKMKLYRIRVLIGDTVEVLVDPYGGKGRLIKRL